jgi:hypothetical protein
MHKDSMRLSLRCRVIRQPGKWPLKRYRLKNTILVPNDITSLNGNVTLSKLTRAMQTHGIA